MNVNDNEVKWSPIGDCQAVWRKQPAPRDPRREQVEGARWVPPSEDPWFLAKWARIRAGAEA